MQESEKPLRTDPGLDLDADGLVLFIYETWGSEYVQRFEDELADAIDLIEAYPEILGFFFDDRFRRRYLKSVPVYVVYEAREEDTLVIAASHSNADPSRILDLIRHRAPPPTEEETGLSDPSSPSSE